MIPWAAIGAIGSLFAVIAVIIGAAYTHGRLTQQVTTNRDDIAEVRGIVVKQSDKLEEHGQDIAALKQKNFGYINGATR